MPPSLSVPMSHVIDSIKHFFGSFHLPSYEIRGSFASFICDQFTCVQIFCNTTTPTLRHFFAYAREGEDPSLGE